MADDVVEPLLCRNSCCREGPFHSRRSRSYHESFCNVIPSNDVQIQNMPSPADDISKDNSGNAPMECDETTAASSSSGFYNAIFDAEFDGEWDVLPFADDENFHEDRLPKEDPVDNQAEPEESLFDTSVVPLEIDPESPVGEHLNFEPLVLPPTNSPLLHETGAPKLSDNDLLDLKQLTKTERLMVRLCDVARQAKAPLYLVDAIVEIVQDEARGGLDLKTPMLKREAFLGHLLSRFKVDPPEMYRVELETNQHKDVPYGPEKPPPKPPQLIDRKKEKMKLYKAPGLDVTYVFKFKFREQLESLLFDPSVMSNMENFIGCVNPDDPFARYRPLFGKLDEIVDGRWFQRTWDACFKKLGHQNFLVIPLIIYLDKTGTDKFQRHGMEPLLLMLGIMNRAARNKAEFKRLLGYLPDLDNSSSATKDGNRNADSSIPVRNYHRILKVIMDDIASNQGWTEEIIMDIRIGNFIRKVNVFFPIAFFIQDGKSGDTITGRMATKKGGNCPSRLCNLPFESLDDPYAPCSPPDFKKVSAYSEKLLQLKGLLNLPNNVHHTGLSQKQLVGAIKKVRSQLKSVDRHAVDLATRNCWFGEQNAAKIGENVFGASPPDMMHAFLHGLLRYLIKVYIVPMTSKEKAELDKLVEDLFGGIRSGEKNNFPRVSFVKGITNLTLLTADEWAGIAMVLVIVHKSEAGRDLFERVRYRREKADDAKNRRSQASSASSAKKAAHQSKLRKTEVDGELEEFASGTICKADCFTYIVEMMLCFHAFYKQKDIILEWDEQDMEGKLDRAIRHMLYEVTVHLPRIAGNGWKVQKFHDILHLALYMSEFGSAMNFDTSNGEQSLKVFVKNIVHSCQQNRGQLKTAQQAADRLHAHAALDRALLCMADSSHANLMSRIRKTKSANRNCEDVLAMHEDMDDDTAIPDQAVVPVKPTFKVYLNHGLRMQYKDGSGKASRKGDPIVQWCGDRRRYETGSPLHPLAVSHLSCSYKEEDTVIDCFSHVRTAVGTLFRAHPDYQREGPWYDWAAVPWTDTEKEGEELGKPSSNFGCYGKNYFPAKILCIFRCPKDEDIHVLVHSAGKYCRKEATVTMEVWEMEYSVDRNGSRTPVFYDAKESLLPAKIPLERKERMLTELSIPLGTKVLPLFYSYSFHKSRSRAKAEPGKSWERQCPVIRTCRPENLYKHIFVIPEEKLLPDGRRDVIVSNNEEDTKWPADFDRELPLEEIKARAKARLVPFQKVQTPSIRKQDRLGKNKVQGPRIIVEKPRDTFWASEFVEMKKKLRGKKYDPIVLQDEDPADGGTGRYTEESGSKRRRLNK